jgi:hypothetical protein
MGDIQFPAAFLFQTLNVIENFARRTQRGQMTANTTYKGGAQMQTELPSNAYIDLDSFNIIAKISYAAKNPGEYQAWPSSVAGFIQNLTISINGEVYQSTDYTSELDVLLKDFSYGAPVKNRMGVMSLGKKSSYKTSIGGTTPAFDSGQHDDGSDRYIMISSADLLGFMATVQPRILQTGLIGPVVISITLKGNDCLGSGTGAGAKYCCAVSSSADPAAKAAALAFPDAVAANAPVSDVVFANHPGNVTSAQGDGDYTFSNVETLFDVLSFPPEYTQFTQMALASGRGFQMPFQNWSVIQNPIDTSLGRVCRFSIASSNVCLILSWMCPDQRKGNRFFDEVTHRSARYNRVLPDSWQFDVSGTLYPPMPCDKLKYSWPVFLSSVSKAHDTTHCFHPGLSTYPLWASKFGVMAVRFDFPDEAGGKSWYSGLETRNQSIQCFVNTVDSGTAVAMAGSQYVAVLTTKVITIMANRATSQRSWSEK